MSTGYANMREVQAAALLSQHSRYWFSPSTLAFFNSVVESDVIGGRYFITSERRETSMPKRYTVRECVDGEINDVSEFQEYATWAGALARAAAEAAGL